MKRWRTGLFVVGLAVPLGLYAVVERQSRRLEVLGREGIPIEARVTAVSKSVTHYAYEVDGQTYTWNVARGMAPFDVGATFPAIYSPSDPTLSRPYTERTLAAAEAVNARSFILKLAGGIAFFLLGYAGIVQRDISVINRRFPSRRNAPQTYRQRLLLTGLLLSPILVAIGAFHFSDARAHNESVIPGLIGSLIGISILVAIFVGAGRLGPAKAHSHSVKILRWAAPIAAGAALLRLLAEMFAGK